MKSPQAKGWCPGAWRPMMSGDGLVVRVRPPAGRLSKDQVLRLCDLAAQLGNGTIDLTSRANLQMRGLRENTHEAAIDALHALDLLDADPELEGRRNILVTPFWEEGDLAHRLHKKLVAALPELPELPAKMGFAIDTKPQRLLADASADVRIERTGAGELLLRADGASTGVIVTENTVLDTVLEMLDWFVRTGGRSARRMARHLQDVPLPDWFAGVSPGSAANPMVPGPNGQSCVYAAVFGAMQATELADLVKTSGAAGLRTTPWRMIVLENASCVDVPGFAAQHEPALMDVHACPGAPHCSAALAQTRNLATQIARDFPRTPSLHVSGCSKGCAFPRAAAVTLVGTENGFDLVRNGAPWDEPARTALTFADITKEMTA